MNNTAPTPIAASVFAGEIPKILCPCGSELQFSACHGSLGPAPQPVVIAPEPKTVKLDLGCGQNPRDGFEGVDLFAPNVKHRVNLFQFPFPFESDSVDEIHCSHFVEHIPAREIEEKDLVSLPEGLGGAVNAGHASIIQQKGKHEQFVGQDMLFAFFDECYRIMKTGAVMHVIVPALQTVRAFQDPTHRRFIPAEMFFYLHKEWRDMNKLDHYNVRCNFSGNVTHSCDTEMNLLSPEAAQRRFKEGWNTMYDFHVDLVKK